MDRDDIDDDNDEDGTYLGFGTIFADTGVVVDCLVESSSTALGNLSTHNCRTRLGIICTFHKDCAKSHDFICKLAMRACKSCRSLPGVRGNPSVTGKDDDDAPLDCGNGVASK